MSASPNPANVAAVNVTALIDNRHLGRYQIAIVALCSLIALLDGADTSSIAIAATTIAGRLEIPMSAFGMIFSAGTLGAMIGAMTFGLLADRFGRKRMLLVATVLFGLFTLLTAHADSYDSLIACRLAAGLGLGGATPCFLALASEYAPQRRRGTLVSVLWAAFPLGVMLGGFLNAYIVANFGWQAIFQVGGVLPLLLVVPLAIALPESLQFLIGRRGDDARAARILGRLAPGAVPRGAALTVADDRLAGVPIRHLFAEGRATGTLLLWAAFFIAFGVLAVVVLFTPALLRGAGIATPSAGALVNGFHGLGGLVGMAIAGRLVDRFGPAPVLSAAFLVGALCTAGLGLSLASVSSAAGATALVGVFVGIAGSGCIALSSLLYPAPVRATGIGWAVAMGRGGQVVAPLVAAGLLATGSGGTMLLAMAGSLVAAVLFVLLLGRHTGRPADRPIAALTPAQPR